MQFKVPQNVQREDQILGPLTMKQLIIAIIGGGIAWILWKAIEAPLSYFFVTIVGILTVAIVLVKVQGMTFTEYCSSLLLLILRPRSRSWQKGGGEVWLSDKDVTDLARIRAERAKKQEEKTQKNVEKLNELGALADILDTRGRVKKVAHKTSSK